MTRLLVCYLIQIKISIKKIVSGVIMHKLNLPFRKSSFFLALILTSAFIAAISAVKSPLLAQTCSCAGAPLISSQSLGIPEKGNLFVGLTGNYNNIDKLYSGTDKLNNRTSERNTFTSLIEINYGLTNRVSLTGAFTFVRKERIAGLQTQAGARTLQTPAWEMLFYLLNTV